MHTRASFTALIGMALAVLALALLLTSDSVTALRAAALGTPPDQQSAEQGSQAVAPAPLSPVYQSINSRSTITFAYDVAGRLTQADYGLGRTIAYTYDQAGNLLQRVERRILGVYLPVVLRNR